MTPIVDGLEQTYRGRLVFNRVNANEGDGPAIMRDYHIPGHPTTLVFDRQGREVQRFIGPQPVEALEDVILTVVKD
ncbi:MAG: thioredoxin family protein [Anaerolineales bacterium]|nr:thioredoxin family protein [Anaerolineales bacterium]